jgi:hypothetical protein
LAPDRAGYMGTLGFDGQGIYDRAEELIAEHEALWDNVTDRPFQKI